MMFAVVDECDFGEDVILSAIDSLQVVARYSLAVERVRSLSLHLAATAR